ncbi:MAG: hypothetical protein M3133_04685 [Actinomycetota bacterium]|nr:hypothetical protein [Actinomycetota bacterium]
MLGDKAMDGQNETLTAILGPTGPEVTCDECFDRLDEYVEVELRGEDAEAQVPGMRAHFEGCRACREEYESLRAFLESA